MDGGPKVREGDLVRVVIEGRAENVYGNPESFSVVPQDKAWGGVRVHPHAPYVATVVLVKAAWQPGDAVLRRSPNGMSVAVYAGDDRWRVNYQNGSFGEVATRPCLSGGLSGATAVTPLVRGGKVIVDGGLL